MSKIKSAFKDGKAIIPFITCGDPDLETTEKVVRAAAENGADLIELGIPFSDPMAEGPVIQAANIRALAGGVTTDKIFDMVKRLRGSITVPMVFMTYANVVFSYGAEPFISACHEMGIDGLVLPDIPFEEKEEFLPVCRRCGVELISFITSASASRIKMISKEAEGFLYIVSGEVEAQTESLTDLAALVSVVRQSTDVPCAIGLGTAPPAQAGKMAAISDGVIAESAVIKLIEQHGKAAPGYVGEYIQSVKQAICPLT